MRDPKRDDDTGLSEMRAFGEELIATGARYIDAGKRWFNDRRDEMASRDDYGRGGQDRRDFHDRNAPRQSRDPDAYRRGPDDDGHGRSAWLGSRYERPDTRAYDVYGQDQAQWDDNAAHGYGDPEIARSHAQRNERHPHEDRATEQRDAAAYGAGAPYAQFARGQSPGGRTRARDAGGRGYGGADATPGGMHDREDRWADRGHRGDHDAMDRQTRGGGWRGIGPKGYARSDARITEDVCEHLMHDDDVDAREVSVQVRDGVVTLEGHVAQRWIKHRIEDIAERCAGVHDVENRIRVQGAGRRGDDSDGPGAQRVRTSDTSASGAQPDAGSGAAGSLGASGAGADEGKGTAAQTSLRSEDARH